MLELAGRVYWIFPLVIAAVFVAWKFGYLTGRATPGAIGNDAGCVGNLAGSVEQQQEQLIDQIVEKGKQQEQMVELLK